MDSRGIKRKYPDEDVWLDGQPGLPSENYAAFRQSMLHISQNKYNQDCAMGDTNLLRFVLLSNTLRVIRDDVQRVPDIAPFEDECVSEASVRPPGVEMETSAREAVGTRLPEDLENILVPSAEVDDTLTRAIANLLKELENVLEEDSPQKLPRLCGGEHTKAQVDATPETNASPTKDEPVSPPPVDPVEANPDIALIKELVLAAACSEKLPELPVAMDTSILEEVADKSATESTLPETPVSMDTVAKKVEPVESQPLKSTSSSWPAQTLLRPMDVFFSSFEAMSYSYLSDFSSDDPFSDIDTSVFEREGSFSSGRYFPQEDCRHSSSCNTASCSSGQGVRENDLDNIMEILVGY